MPSTKGKTLMIMLLFSVWLRTYRDAGTIWFRTFKNMFHDTPSPANLMFLDHALRWDRSGRSESGSGAPGLLQTMWLSLGLYRHGNMAEPGASVNKWLSKEEWERGTSHIHVKRWVFWESALFHSDCVCLRGRSRFQAFVPLCLLNGKKIGYISAVV